MTVSELIEALKEKNISDTLEVKIDHGEIVSVDFENNYVNVNSTGISSYRKWLETDLRESLSACEEEIEEYEKIVDAVSTGFNNLVYNIKEYLKSHEKQNEVLSQLSVDELEKFVKFATEYSEYEYDLR